jgi:3',5'-nucleoside bisphosphate phosphatase
VEVIDLHMHSLLSDGSDEPEVLADLAASVGCSTIALTDHDRLDGIERVRAHGATVGVSVIGGVELSCAVSYDVPGVRPVLHILVYFVEPGEGALQTELVRQMEFRRDRNERLVERLRALGINITFEDLVAAAGKVDGIGRPHVAKVLVEKGVVATTQEAFDKWLGKGQPGYVEREEMTADVALKLARESGGVAVIAHPFSLGLAGASFTSALTELREQGLSGMECIYGRYTTEERHSLAQIAQRLDMVATGGSDYHGVYKPDLRVGIGKGDLRVPDTVLDELAARRSAV